MGRKHPNEIARSAVEMILGAEGPQVSAASIARKSELVRAAWALCDDTETTVFTDEFGEHYRVPKASWDRLERAVAALTRGDDNA